MNRRHFIKGATVVGGISILPSCLVLGQTSTSGRLPASERVNLAVVGIGNRGGGNLQTVTQTGLCNIVALCDVDLQGEQCVEALQAHPNAPRFTDFRKMFDEMEKEIDAVLISTADHAHIASGACLTGAVSVGTESFIGARSVVRQGLTIGACCTIGMGSVVIRSLPDHSTAYGVPARQ